MSLSTKILLFIFGVLVLSAAGFVVYKQIENQRKLDAIQASIVETKLLVDGITRSESRYATKDDINDFAKKQDLNIAAIQKDLDGLNAQVKAIGSFTIISTGQTISGATSTSVTPRPDPIPNVDQFGYMNNTQNLELKEKFANIDVPIGKVSFSAFKEKPWDYTIFDRKYTVNTVIGINENGDRHYSYNQVVLDTNGKRYIIPINDSKFLEEYPSAKFSFFNPHLFLGFDGSANINKVPITGEMTPSISVGIMSYGKSKKTPDLSILQVGVGYGAIQKTPEVVISPIQYNLGQHLSPFVNNLYVGPNIAISTGGDVGVGAGIRVGL